MFDIFVKRKKIVIDFITTDAHVYTHAKPVRAHKVLPQWFLDLQKSYVKYHPEEPNLFITEATIKKCPGIIDMYYRSIAMTSWFDAEMDIHSNGDVTVRRGVGELVINEHPREQFEPFVAETRARNLKVDSPWAIKCNRDIKILVTEPTWHSYQFHNSLSVMPGVTQPRYTWATNINYITRPSSETKTLFFEPGDPLAIFTPITEDDFEIKHHVVPEYEAVKRGVFVPKWGVKVSDDKAPTREYGIRYHRRIVDKLKKLYGEDNLDE